MPFSLFAAVSPFDVAAAPFELHAADGAMFFRRAYFAFAPHALGAQLAFMRRYAPYVMLRHARPLPCRHATPLMPPVTLLTLAACRGLFHRDGYIRSDTSRQRVTVTVSMPPRA